MVPSELLNKRIQFQWIAAKHILYNLQPSASTYSRANERERVRELGRRECGPSGRMGPNGRMGPSGRMCRRAPPVPNAPLGPAGPQALERGEPLALAHASRCTSASPLHMELADRLISQIFTEIGRTL